MRLALFGCGRIGRVHAQSVADHPRAELVWVCDPMTAPASELAAQYGARATDDVDAVFADASVDAVIIGSPTPTHVELMIKAVQAGKAVLCEKPIDLDLARVDACWQEISAADPTIMLGFNRRFDPSFAQIRARVQAGEIGRLEHLAITSRDPAPPPASYVASSGGLFRDMTIHDFDLARAFLGDIVEVTATGANLVSPDIEAAGDIDAAVITLRSAEGGLATIVNSRRCSYGYDQRLEAFGATGSLLAENQRGTSVRAYSADRTDSAAPYFDFFLERYMPAYRAELDHFITSVENGTAPSPGFADGREALVLADAANESVRTGSVVRLA